MIIHEFDLDMIPDNAITTVKVNQYDDDFNLKINLFSRKGGLTIQAGTEVIIRGKKPDGHVFSADCSINGNVVTVVGNQQMTAAAGRAIFELSLRKNGKELNSANFIMKVERAPMDKDTPPSNSVIRELVDALDHTDEILEAAESVEEWLSTIDDTLSQPNKAADAKKTGDEIADLKSALTGELSKITEVETVIVDKNICTKLSAYVSVTGDIGSDNHCSLIYFICQPDVKYTISKVASVRFRVGYMAQAPSNNSTVNGLIKNDGGTSIEITTPITGAQYLVIYYYDSQNDTLAESDIYNSLSIIYQEDSTAVDKTARNNIATLQSNKVDKQQNVSDAGKVLVINNAGILTPSEYSDGGLSDDAKNALLNCFRHVSWIDEYGQDYYNTLRASLYGDDAESISVAFTPGTHVVYTTDSVESLRHFLVVTATYADGTTATVSRYTLIGDISSPGVKTITVIYGMKNKTATFTVTVVSNTSGIIYEWDFTKSLVDLRQYKEATLGVGEEGNGTFPTMDSTGLHFTGPAQYCNLFNSDYVLNTQFFGKTIEVDVSNFTPQETNANIRVITFADPEYIYGDGSNTNYPDGFVFRKEYGWSFYNGSSWASNIFSGMNTASYISGKTLGLFINSSGSATLYVNGVSKGTADNTITHTLYGIRLGNHNKQSGANFYNATITGARIYSGEVS